QHLGIGERAHLRIPRTHDLLELLLVAQHVLRLFLVLPERGARGHRIELFDLQALLIDVKATSGARSPSWRAPSAARERRAHPYLRSPWPQGLHQASAAGNVTARARRRSARCVRSPRI